MFEDASFIWLLIIIFLSVVEIITAQLVSIWFVLAAVVALFVSFFSNSVILQVLVFIVSTLIFLICTRPIVKKIMSFEKEDTNLGKYIGKKAIVISEINNDLGKGQVIVGGITWTAKSDQNIVIEKGANVLIKSIEGVKLVVSKCD